MTTSTLPARLRRIQKEMGWSRGEIAAAAGASRQAVSNWFRNGTRRTIEARFGFNLQRVSGFSAEWILYGKGPERVTTAADDFPAIEHEMQRFKRRLIAIVRREIDLVRDQRHK